ncbi:hypothetical protein V5S96_00455 [Corynebacterium mastitidis]|uniref:Serine protease n=1 Tax=Corynebacterium mastitidis TaxID=161890 RepID=A0ABU8NV09_9CORY
MRIRRATLAMLASLTCVSAVAGAAGQASAAEVAPGAPMRTYLDIPEGDPLAEAPREVTTMACTQGIPGTVTLPDGSRKDVMVTAGHCVWGTTASPYETQPEVYVPLREGDRLVGLREGGRAPYAVGSEDDVAGLYRQWVDDDWATIELAEGERPTRVADSVDQFGQSHGEPVVLTGVRDYPDLAPGELAFDNLGQPICKDGQTTGRSCGIQFMRTGNRLWSVNTMIPGDSGGVNFDPVTGEALGVSTNTFFGVVGITQGADVALEETYGIPDGQVNDYFALPDSTEEHTEMRTFGEDMQVVYEWVEEQQEASADPADVALDTAYDNAEAAVDEVNQWSEATAQQLVQNPANVPALVERTQETAENLGTLAQETLDVLDYASQEA